MNFDDARKALKERIALSSARNRTGIVTEVNKETCVCDVQLTEQEEITLFNVRLRATDDEQDAGMLLFPKVGSDVIVGDISTGGYYVAMFSEIDSVVLKNENTLLKIDSAGYQFSRGDESLKKLLTDLLDALIQLVLLTNTGPTTGVSPQSLQQLNQIKQRISTLLQ